jgi:oxalate decarboxylase
MNDYTRRGFLGAVGGTAALSVASALGQQTTDRSRSQPGPQNPKLDEQNVDSITPPPTDAGAVPPFKYPFSLAHKRLHEGGWSREVTVRELEIAKTLAGVDMRLTAGGIRELHWHAAAEWALMLYGNARITAVDLDGKAFVSDVGKGDLWFFPAGVPHSIQGLGPDGAEFMLVFDDGSFSEFTTVLFTDWLRHTPEDVLARNLGVKPQQLSGMPKQELFIFQRPVPGPLEEDRCVAAGAKGLSSQMFDFRPSQMPPSFKTRGGEVRIVDSRNFKSTTISSALVTLNKGGLRELHWHPNADEWLFFPEGKARVTVFATGARARTMDFQAGDVGYIEKTLPHYIENTGDGPCSFIEMFKSPTFQDLSLNEWIAHEPPELIMQHLGIDRATLDAIPKEKFAVLPV